MKSARPRVAGSGFRPRTIASMGAGCLLLCSAAWAFLGRDDAAPLRPADLGLTAARVEGGRRIAAAQLGASDYCGQCHLQIFHEWDASSHHFSSFNNPYYRRVAADTRARRGAEALKFCAGCHDPLPLVSGELADGTEELWSRNAGITCLTCHRITEVHGGNGGYTLSAPVLHPFALSDSPVLREVHDALVRMTPALHRAALAKPFYGSAEYCASCHQLTGPKALNGTRDVVLQNDFGEWQQSHFAAPVDGAAATTCRDCHMPLVPSGDPAAKQGLARSHRFTGGNTALASLNRDDEQLQATVAFLRDGRIAADCVGFARNDDPVGPCGELRAGGGDRIRLALRVANRGVGHSFPAGTVDSDQAWMEVAVEDAGGRSIFHSGRTSDSGEVDAGARFFRSVPVDRTGRALDRRTATTEAVGFERSTVIHAGAASTLEYPMAIPRDAAFPLSVRARVLWRKFAPEFSRWVFEGKPPPALPVTTLAETRFQISPLGIARPIAPGPITLKENER